MNSLSFAGSIGSASLRGQQRINTVVRSWIYLYGVTWIVEGALRKWVAPGASDFIYFGRDLLTVGALLLVVSAGVPSRKASVFSLTLVAALLVGILACAQLILSPQPIAVRVLGVRDLLMPVLAAILLFLSSDRLAASARLEKVLLAATPVQALITVLQVTSPETSVWNSVVNDEATTLLTSADVVRASGSFTSPTGLTAFVTLSFALTLAGLLSSARKSRRLLVVSMLSCLLILLLGGSRGAILNAVIVLIAGLIWTVISSGRTSTVLRLVTSVAVSYLAARMIIHLFPSIFGAFIERAETAGNSEDSTARILNDMFGYWRVTFSALGDGIGSHLLAGQAAGSTGGWIEGELTRWVTELGLLGLVLILARQTFAILLLLAAWRRSRKEREPHALLLSVILTSTLLYGAVGSTPTQQGFTVVTLAFLMSCYIPGADSRSKPAKRDEEFR